MIPMAEEILVSVDRERRRVEVRLPEGLLEDDGPEEEESKR